MQVRITIICISFFLCCTSIKAQFTDGNVRLEQQDSIEYFGNILIHIFSLNSKEAIPAAERLYSLGEKYKNNIEMFNASVVLASHYNSFLSNKEKYEYWKNKAHTLLTLIDVKDKRQYQEMYNLILDDQIVDTSDDLESLRTHLNNLRGSQRNDEALPVAKRIVEKEYIAGIPNKARYISDLTELGAVYACNKNDTAEAVLKEAISLSLQNDNYDIQHILDTYILACVQLEDVPNGLLVCNKFIELLHKKYGKYSLELYEAYEHKAMLLQIGNRYEESLEAHYAAFDIQKEIVLNTFPYFTEDERYYYWQRNFSNNVNFVKCAFNKDVFLQEELIEKAYDQQLFTKGVLLNTSNALRREFEDNPSVEDKWNQIVSLRRHMLKDSPDNSAELEIKANTLERELAESIDLSLLKQNIGISSKDVYDALGDNDIAIEFVDVILSWNMPYCVFLTIDKKHPKPRVKTFLGVDMLKSKLAEDYSTNCDVYDTLWKKLLEGCDSVKNIYFSPTGIFSTIPLEHCMTDNGQLMSERYNIFRVSSTRELVTNRKSTEKKSATIYGGIEFGTSVSQLQTDAKKYNKVINTDLAYRGGDAVRSWKDHINPLTNTLTEAQSISKILKKQKYDVKLRKGAEATEASFKSLSTKSPSIIHIATHGFFWNTDESKEYEDLDFMKSTENQLIQHEDVSLTRSGLLFAGAYNVMKKQTVPDGVDDGVCTSAEISQLDLSNTDLIILSACDTGLGEQESDGVFGLQRGFKKAGVNSILMSLWPVNDKATMLFMTEFYKKLASGMSKTESLRAAQRYVRAYNNGYYEAKENWAGFILLDAIR